MKTHTRVVSALLVAVLVGGPLSTLASAQQPAQPPAPAVQQPPAAQPPAAQPPAVQPPAPDLFQESLKAERTTPRQSRAYDAGAVVTNVFLVPGRAITCGIGALLGVGVLAVTLGTAYRASSAVWNEGCGGKWVVTGDDLRPDGPSNRPLDYTEMR
jgi:hypothetical protein